MAGQHGRFRLLYLEHKIDTWFHIVLNVAGICNITVYHDGVEVTNSTESSRSARPATQSNGRIILGNNFDSLYPRQYNSMCIDELMFHNHVLTKEDITQLIHQW